MQFSSSVFLILFLPAVMLLYLPFVRCARWKNLVLLLSSLVFYAWGEPLFIFILLGSIGVNYLFGIALERCSPHPAADGKKRVFPFVFTRHSQRIEAKRKGSLEKPRLILICSCVFNIGILFVFKYLTFVLGTLSHFIEVSIPAISLPIGISFYSFQIMSYVFDVYRGTVPAQNNIFSLALYVSMFPQLVAGPIVRYSAIEKEIKERTETFEDFSQGSARFIVGLSKKVMIADFLGGVADKIFLTSEYGEIAAATAWIGALAYTLEIYYDFSGYSDMAIGLGRCFGFHYEENFHYPYMASSVTEFWRRWHISLTSWFRDYVYIPLGGNRVSPRRHILNLLVVWLLTGIWHGAEWTFILWGLLYFLIQTLEKYVVSAVGQRGNALKPAPRILAWGLHCYTMLVVMMNWVLFKASNMTSALRYFRTMFAGRPWDSDALLYLKSSAVVMVLGIIGCFPFARFLEKKAGGSPISLLLFSAGKNVALVILLICSLLLVINGTYSPFIYFNF